MAFPTGWTRKCALVIQNSQVDANLTNFPVLVTKDTLPTEIIDADHAGRAQSDGGDIRFSSDAAGSTQLACEVVRWSQNNDPSLGDAEIWVKVPTVNGASDTTIYIWWKAGGGGGETQPAAGDTYGSQNAWNANFLSVWHLHQNPAGGAPQMSDSTVTAKHGTTAGTMVAGDSVSGKIYNAVNTDGTDDEIDFGTMTSMDALATMTAEVWINPDAVSGAHHFWGKSNGTTGVTAQLVLRPGGEVRFNMYYGAAMHYGETPAATVAAAGGWYHIQCAYNGAGAANADRLKIWVNGVAQTLAFSGTIDATLPTNAAVHFTIGQNDRAANDELYDGQTDEMRYSDTNRSVDWLTASYRNQNNPNAFIVESTSTPVLIAPTSPAVVAVTGTYNLTISWTDNNYGETGYEIERSNDGAAGWALITTAAADATSYTDTSIAAGDTTRYYRIRAVDTGSSQNGPYSATANGTTAPTTPTGLTIAAVSNSNNLTVTWVDASSTDNNVRVERSNNGSSGWAEIATSPVTGAVTTTDNVAARDTLRYYRVRAFRTSDSMYSPYSSNASATTSPADPSATAVAAITGGLRVSWTDNSSTESTFSIERKRTSGGTYAELTTDTTSPYDDTALPHEDATYFYRVRAYRSSDAIYSGYDTAASAGFPPTIPTDLQAFAKNDVTGNIVVQLMWDRDSRYETGFTVQRSTDDAAWSTIATAAKGATTYEDSSGLSANTTYYYRIRATGNSSNSEYTSSVSVKTKVNTGSGLVYAFLKKVRSFPRE